MSAPARLPTLVRSAVESALGDLERALGRDRSHAVLAAPSGAAKEALLQELPVRLGAALRVAAVSAAEAEGGALCARLLTRLGQAPAAPSEAEPWLRALARDLATRGRALVVLVDDAASLSPAALGRLGALAADSGGGLRLVLVVTGEGRIADVAIAESVLALGAGAQKIALALPQAEPPPVMPPERPRPVLRATAGRESASPARGGRRVRAASHRSGSARQRGGGRSRGAAWALASGATLAAVALPLWLHATPVAPLLDVSTPPMALVPARRPAPARVAATASVREVRIDAAPEPAPAPRPEETVAASGRSARDAAAGAGSAVRVEPDGRVGAIAAAEPTGPAERTPAGEPLERGGSADAAASGREEPVAPAAPPPRPVAVSLNATPWARIEVDGRPVGVTPLADVPLAPGRHRFRAHLPDGRVVEREVHVDAYRNHLRFP